MQPKRLLIGLLTTLSLTTTVLSSVHDPGVAAVAAPVAPSKLIALSGILKPFRYLEHRAELESLPFDGYAIAFQASWQPFFSSGINAPGFAQDQADLAAIGQDRLKDSFALIWATPPTDSWDWFDDAAWQASEVAIRTIARTARAVGMKGVMFDPEPYQDRFVWGYDQQPIPAGRATRPTFDEYRTKIFQRGQRFMEILQDEAPGLTVMTTRLFTDASADLKGSATYEDFLRARQEDKWFGLGESFSAGMVRATTGGTTLIEGNERGYDYAVTNDFTSANAEIRDGLRWLAYPDDRETYDSAVQPGHPSYIYGVMTEQDSRFIGFYLPDRATRLKVLQDNVRNSLEQSSTYAWTYADTETPVWELASTQPDVLSALRAAKGAAGSGQPPAADQGVASGARDAYVNKQLLIGRVSNTMGPLPGLTVEPSEPGMSCLPTDGDGLFFCYARKGWTGTLTPQLKGSSFSPSSRFVEPLNSFRNGFNFEASPG
jgi:hypothetical protein